MYLARKIARAKWNPMEELADDEVPADAVTADLRTTKNALSFWRCDKGADIEVEAAVLAIASGFERLDKLDVFWLCEKELLRDGQKWKDTEGRTPVTELVKRHVDVHQLDYVRLGKIADRVVAAIKDNRWRRFSKKDVAKLLVAAVDEGRVSLDKLEEKVQAEVRKSSDIN